MAQDDLIAAMQDVYAARIELRLCLCRLKRLLDGHGLRNLSFAEPQPRDAENAVAHLVRHFPIPRQRE